MKILVIGATGFLGRRLTEQLLKNSKLRLRLFVRDGKKVSEHFQDKVEIVEGDTFNSDALLRALQGIDAAYYLVHTFSETYNEMEIVSARNFVNAAIDSKVKRIIYLSGLTQYHTTRHQSGQILSAYPDKIQTIWLRVGALIGSGSAGFEMLYHLISALPIMVTPRWTRTNAQPIAVSDVLRYLASAHDRAFEGNAKIDLGVETLSFQDMLKQGAEAMGFKRLIIPLPAWIPEISAYWLILFTPIPFSMVFEFIERFRKETQLLNNLGERYFPDIKPLSFKDAFKEALDDMTGNQVKSRWCDSYGPEGYCDLTEQALASVMLTDRQTACIKNLSPEHVFASVMLIGGRSGWFRFNLLWEIRGLIDKLVGGYGLSRGRRNQESLRIGDCLDFWKVVDLRSNERLLLGAQMKNPGKAWLEFRLDSETLTQTAYYNPDGFWGRFYRALMAPFHFFIFRDMIRQIVSRAEAIQKKAL
jgi:uncharacterized protein YbjT (DUF2867 family)